MTTSWWYVYSDHNKILKYHISSCPGGQEPQRPDHIITMSVVLVLSKTVVFHPPSLSLPLLITSLLLSKHRKILYKRKRLGVP